METKRIGAILLRTLGIAFTLVYLAGLFWPEVFAAHGLDLRNTSMKLVLTLLAITCLNLGNRLHGNMGGTRWQRLCCGKRA